MPDLDDRWKTWIWQNVGRGCHKDHIFKALLDRGFAYEAIRTELRHEPSQPLENLDVPMVAESTALGHLDPDTLERREVAPYLWEIPGVLSPGDCAALIEVARDRLTPSTIVTDTNKQGGEGEGKGANRTSSGVAFEPGEAATPEFAAVMVYLRRAIADLAHLPEEHQESIQILRYGPDEKFEPHRDDFSVGSEYLRWEGQRGGQRLFSFMVYLNDVEAGGETVFPSLDVSVAPTLGKGIFWPNVMSDGRPLAAALHGSAPVVSGEKWVLVCWVREAPFGRSLDHPGISDRRGLAAWLPEEVPLEPPPWIVADAREQQAVIPFLGAGGKTCRGFAKRRLDPELHAEILSAYRAVEPELRLEEGDAIGNFLCTVRPELPVSLYLEVKEFNTLVHQLLKPMHEEWCGFPLRPSACYGFRVYLPGAFLHNHVDRARTHVISSTICVDRELYTPWMLHAVDVDGRDHQVDLEPGELLLYESARILHGRPAPLNGRYYVGLFAHYEPAEDTELWTEQPSAWFEKHRR